MVDSVSLYVSRNCSISSPAYWLVSLFFSERKNHVRKNRDAIHMDSCRCVGDFSDWRGHCCLGSVIYRLLPRRSDMPCVCGIFPPGKRPGEERLAPPTEGNGCHTREPLGTKEVEKQETAQALTR